ncbi:hypothetical protein T11_6932 [Trichinella zimbabwensis]|uniref:Uncharacterized protein n=1 Tax=Trichinella zimbabwensis TaxID=268475 RepID=A0A0V1HN33_9BILA|nr:hypothetical protein T11_6932 [Trichinella zimbabwensis]
MCLSVTISTTPMLSLSLSLCLSVATEVSSFQKGKEQVKTRQPSRWAVSLDRLPDEEKNTNYNKR